MKGTRRADLTWSGASSTIDIYRNNVRIVAGTANDGFHTDNIGGKGAGSFTYRVCHAGHDDLLEQQHRHVLAAPYTPAAGCPT